MKKSLPTFIVLCGLIAVNVLSCDQPVEVKAPPEPVPVAAPLIQEEDIYMFTVQPIKAFDKYVSTEDGKVYGIAGDTLEVVKLLSGDDGALKFHDFRVVDGVAFFQVQTWEADGDGSDTEAPAVEVIRYYSQDGEALTEIEAGEYPDAPAREYQEYSDKVFKIETGEWEGAPKSDVYCGTRVRAYIQVDGVARVEAGLWYSVSESFGTVYAGHKGVWFCSEDDKRKLVLDSGRIW